jgi:hypothetical protein
MIFSYLLFLVISTTGFSQTKKPYVKGQSVAVVGAGVTGLSVVRTLIKNGVDPKLITVFEKDAQAGGKVSTIDVDNLPVEVGAAVIIKGRYKQIEDMATEHGLTTRPLGQTKFMDLATGRTLPGLSADELQEFRAQVGFYLKMYKEQWGNVSTAYGYGNLHPDLMLSWNEFLKKYENQLGKLFFRLSTALGGSGYLVTQNPPYAAQIIRYINPQLLMSVLTPGNVHIFNKVEGKCLNRSSKNISGGFQCLWMREAEKLSKLGVKFMYNTTIMKINRLQNVHVLAQINKAPLLYKFDHLFYTADLRHLVDPRKPLLHNASSTEKDLYRSITSYKYRSYVLRMENFPESDSAIFGILPYMLTGEHRKGVLVERPYVGKDIFQMWAYGDEKVTHEEILLSFQADMEKFGATFNAKTDVLSKNYFDYFPHINPNSKYNLSTFFNKAREWQGHGGLWLAGEVFGFALTIDVFEQAQTFTEDFLNNKL